MPQIADSGRVQNIGAEVVVPGNPKVLTSTIGNRWRTNDVIAAVVRVHRGSVLISVHASQIVVRAKAVIYLKAKTLFIFVIWVRNAYGAVDRNRVGEAARV